MAQAAQRVQVWRIFSDADGKSRMEPIEIPLEDTPGGGWSSRLLAGTGVIFRCHPRGMDLDWHPAPRRQLIATLSGEGEIETGDGQVLRVRPGVITLVEDVSGIGHKTRVIGDQDRLSVFLSLDDETTVP